jgi:Fe2+ or Zn2+ uptake regulation protein
VASEQSGFDITSHHTVFAGVCPACQGAGPHPASGGGARQA